MVGTRTRWSPRMWARPVGLVEQTRWLLWLTALVALLVTLPLPLLNASGGRVALVLGCWVVLSACWSRWYLTGRCPVVVDGVAVLAVAGLALACPVPAAVFQFVVPAVWHRAMYGSTRGAVLQTSATAAGLLAAVAVWGVVPGHDRPGTEAVPVLAVLPILFLTLAVGRQLAAALRAREQSQQRDAALALLGTQLLGITDRGTIGERTWQSVTAICAATPGLQALAVRADGDLLQVERRLPSVAQPVTLPAVPVPAAGQPVDTAAVAAAAGHGLAWTCVPVPEQPGSWLLLGALWPVPGDTQVALQSALNQSALALRSSAAHRDLATQALTDPLTGLGNRTAFSEALEHGLRHEPVGLAVLFLDLDDFKIVNDGLGHAAGDELLCHVADRLRQAVRPGDVCTRLGGDEFAVLLHSAGGGAGAAVAQRLVDLIAAPVAVSGSQVQVGASVGVAYAALGLPAGELVQRADTAMYAAKAQGKNRVQVYQARLVQPDADAAALPAAVAPAAVG